MTVDLRVIIVEDSEDDAFLVERALKKGGFVPSSVRVDTCQALAEVLSRQEWDIVLSDFSMPQCSGLEVLQYLRQAQPHLPVVMVSGVIGEETAATLMRLGAYDYVLKDRLERLCPAVERALHDAAERRERQKSEKKFRAIFERSAFGILILDLERVIVEANAAIARMLGYEMVEIIGQSLSAFALPAEEQASQEQLRGLLRGGGDYAQTERQWRRKDGSCLWVGKSLSLIRDSQGRADFVVCLVEDISARKQEEEEKLEFERRLQQSQKLESLGVMAGGIAHDFNNLLMAILGNLDLALDVAGIPERVRQRIDCAVQASQRAAGLTRQMLDYVGKGVSRVQELDLARLVQDNLALFEAAIPKHISLAFDCQSGVPPVMADPNQIQQVVMNLITNAAEAIDGRNPGEIAIAVGHGDFADEALSTSRLAELPVAGHFVTMTVRDTGCGMDEETKARLFDPFFTTKFMGRGLGMSAVLGIVRSHGGAIMVSSAPGAGTTFQVLLPAAQGQAVAGRDPAGGRRELAEAGHASCPGQRGTILLADDEEMVLSVCRDMLRALGFAVLTARDGQEAVELLAKQRDGIDLVILDLAMPRMDGWAALAEIRHHRPELPIVIATGFDEHEARIGHGATEIAGFISKPYTMKALRALLDGLRPVRG